MPLYKYWMRLTDCADKVPLYALYLNLFNDTGIAIKTLYDL